MPGIKVFISDVFSIYGVNYWVVLHGFFPHFTFCGKFVLQRYGLCLNHGANQQGFCLLFVNFILFVLWFPEAMTVCETVRFSHFFHSFASIAHFRFLVSAEWKIVWLKEIFRLAQDGGELSIFCAGNARPVTDGRALSTL